MLFSQINKDILEQMKLAEQRKDYHMNFYSFHKEFYPAEAYHPSFYQRIGYFLLRWFIIKPFSFVLNHFCFKTIVFGKSNLKNALSGIITSNHIHPMDMMIINHALGLKESSYLIAEEENTKTISGMLLRASKAIPISKRLKGLRLLDEQVKNGLQKGNYITFFPEESQWWCYEKPRPMEMGAFHFAAKYQVPIIPIFITFIKTGRYNKEGIEKRRFIVHILKPIHPNKQESLKENKTRLKYLNEVAIKNCYENFYYQKLR